MLGVDEVIGCFYGCGDFGRRKGSGRQAVYLVTGPRRCGRLPAWPPAGAARFLLLRRPRARPGPEATRWPCSHVAREGAKVRRGRPVGLLPSRSSRRYRPGGAMLAAASRRPRGGLMFSSYVHLESWPSVTLADSLNGLVRSLCRLT